MPIPLSALNSALIPCVLNLAATVAEMLYMFAEQPEPYRCYAVVRLGPDAYDMLALDDLRELTERHGAELLPLAIGAIPGLLRPGEPVYQSRIGQARAEREMHQRHRRRLVVLDDNGDVAGVMASTMLAIPKGSSPLDLISAAAPAVLGEPESIPSAPPHLNTRFDGVAPNAPLIVGRRVPLIVSVGAPTASNAAQSSRPFAFDFGDTTEPVRFTVHVDADPEMWIVREIEPTLIVAPPGTTQQEAEFIVVARQPGRDKLHISVERADTRAVVQHVWLAVTAAHEQPSAAAPVPAAIARIEASQPLDSVGASRPTVELTVQPGSESSVVVVRADLPDGTVRETIRIPVSGAAIQNATLRLRHELEKIVFYPGRQTDGPFPFADLENLVVDEATAREACVPLADAGQQVWDMLFNPPRTDDKLRRLAADLRALPHGSSLRVVLDSQEFIVPWALLYDQPGLINAQTLTWEGFWGYRYILEVFPPGRYPAPAIDDTPPVMLMLLNDDANLRPFTTAQEQYVRETLSGAQSEVAWGHDQVQQALRTPPPTALVYCYCHGHHESGAIISAALASESAVFFSGGKRMRIADLRRLPAGALSNRPLVFLNACEGATQDAFYYDGFMPFFIEQQLARGFIGTEVKAPQLLAHDVALRFFRMFGEGQAVGEILWNLRQHYLKEHNNILAFNYSLYCPGEVRLRKPVIEPQIDRQR